MKRALLLVAALALVPDVAEGFCGFYVGGAGAKLFNNATLVVMMRDGTRTVLSMQNNYQGPPTDFAMVVPVPVVLQEENVKTLDASVFDRVDRLAAPRLVEYWERDPCEEDERGYRQDAMAAKSAAKPSEEGASGGHGVKIEAQFTVGEYEIVILSAEYSQGLEDWLREQKYNIPEGAEPLLRPYVQSGMKFFVAKVDVEKVKLVDGQVMLSPLRFHYDSEKFELPVRLGMVNSAGTQDLIVHILARNKRYETANYKNVFIPTNLRVSEDVREKFGPFYAALFDATLEKNPGAVVTEYAWASGTCDPCPSDPLGVDDLVTLGADVTPSTQGEDQWGWQGDFVLTRLHARYGKGALAEDLIFKEAGAVIGGRGTPDEKGKMEAGVQREAGMNNFQGRYAILHEWQGAVLCKDPVRGQWGGPPGSSRRGGRGGRRGGGGEGEAKAAQNLASAPRGEISLPAVLREDVPELGITAQHKRGLKPSGCGCRVGAREGVALGGPLLALAALAGLVARRRKREA